MSKLGEFFKEGHKAMGVFCPLHSMVTAVPRSRNRPPGQQGIIRIRICG
jgi:hypothetical protein